MHDIKNINVDDVLYDIKDAVARGYIGNLDELGTTEQSTLVAAINELVAQIASLSGITYLESDTNNLVSIRDLASATYVFYGRFKPFAASTSTLTFSSKLLVNVVKQTSTSHVMVFYPVNNCVQYLKITDTTYERKNIYLNDLMDSVGDITDLDTTDKSSLVAAINEVVASQKSGGNVDLSGYLQKTELTEAINTALSQAKESGEFDGKTPAYGVDYWTETDRETIIQQVLTELGAIPVYGTIDEDNNIYLTALLKNGTYYLKYADADGNVTDICTYEHNYVPKPSYKNLFVAETCSINKRGNSSGTSSACDGVFLTEYIDIGNALASGGVNQLHYKGMYFDVNNLTNAQGTPYTYLNYYTESKSHLGHVSMRQVGDTQTDAGDYVVTLDASKTTARYIRVSAAVLPKPEGTLPALTGTDQLAGIKIALNEPITD